ncbi:MAG: hypothetical protein Q7T59_04405 [Candidatus Woesebacteria bacterium]|nr:hypothetical protein [Candidatus Woesebacteria bacterium]
MEQASGQNPIDNLGEFLTKSGLESTSMSFDMVFKGLKYDWGINLIQEKTKTVDEFLKTTIYNANSRRIGLEKQAGTDLGQPGLEIPIYPDEVADAFYLEVYHWKNRAGVEKPEPVTSRVAILIGERPLKDEKSLDYLKRMSSEQNAIYSEEEKAGKKTVKFEAPLKSMPDFKSVVKIESVKNENGYNLMEIALDVKIPYEMISGYLTPKSN